MRAPAALQAMKVKEGDTLYLAGAPADSVRMVADRDGFEEKMRIALRLMDRYPNALRELAK